MTDIKDCISDYGAVRFVHTLIRFRDGSTAYVHPEAAESDEPLSYPEWWRGKLA